MIIWAGVPQNSSRQAMLGKYSQLNTIQTTHYTFCKVMALVLLYTHLPSAGGKLLPLKS